jgi:hypothetical protein
MRCVELDGKRYPIREVLQRYKQQRAEERRAKQLVLFELKDDVRPATTTTADRRFAEPTLFKVD